MEQGIKRSKSQLSNVHKMIDQLKAESAKSFHNRSYKSDNALNPKNVFSSSGVIQQKQLRPAPYRSLPIDDKAEDVNKNNKFLSVKDKLESESAVRPRRLPKSEQN